MADKTCLHCDRPMIGVAPHRKFCSSACRSNNWVRKHGLMGNNLHRNSRNRKTYKDVRDFLRKVKVDSGCIDCGYREHPDALEFDHVKGHKTLNVSRVKSIGTAEKEIAKCEVVCANCHAIRTITRIRGNLGQ